jgi:ribose transport system substrate-binding protein
MDCGTSVCGLLWSVMESAGAAMGVHLIHYLAGPTTQQTASAFSAMLQTKPTAVIILPTSPLLIESDLLTLKADHIPVVTSGITWTSAQVKKYGIGAQQFALSWADTSAKLMAAWVVKTKGTSANVVIENVPDLEFGPAMTAEFKSEMKALCPTCQVSELDIPITTMGTTDTTQEVAYLEAHPNINVVASVSSETYYGVPSILSASNIHVDLIGNAPAPQNLIDIEQGTEAAGVGFDALTSVWTDVDAVARLLDGQPLSQDEITGVNDQQFLVKSDLSGDYSQGWTGYPDTPQRFESFWGVSS